MTESVMKFRKWGLSPLLIKTKKNSRATLLGVLSRVFVIAAVFIASPAWAVPGLNAAKSTATASPTTVIADGIATSTITVTVNRANGQSAGSGITVTLTAGSGSSTILTSPATTNNSGIATFTVKDTVVESVTYTAVASESGGNTVTISQRPVVNFVRAAPTVAKSFSPATIAANGTSTLTITLTNPNAVSISGATFTDTYPANLINAGAPAVSNTCGGTATASAGSSSLALSGGTIPASGSCTVTVTLTSATAGSYANTIAIGAVTSTNALANTVASNTATLVVTAISAANSTVTASPTTVLADGVNISTITVTLRDGANLAVSGKTVTLAQSGTSTISAASGTSDVNGIVTFTVKTNVVQTSTYTATSGGITVTQTAAVTFVLTPILKSFATSPIAANGSSTLAVTLTNSTSSSVSGAWFTDTYPGGLINASNPTNSCASGTLTGASGGNTLGLSGATISKNSACTVSVSVTSATAGTYSNIATTASATSTASLIVTAISATLSTVSASLTSVAAGGISTSTITVTLKDGAGNAVPGKTVSLSAATGSSVITAVSNSAGVAIFTVKDSVAEGPITYTAIDTTDSITVTQTAAVTFTRITAPTVAKSFSPSTIADYGMSTLTITLTNPNTAAINGVAFTDSYPATGGLANTSSLVLSNTCGGTNPGTAANGTKLTLSGGTIPASSSCAVSVQVTAAFPGTTASSPIVNSTGAVTSSNGTSGTAASATLTVVNVSATNSTVVANPTLVPADNTTTSTITVTLKDGVGNLVAGTNVSLAASGGSSTITIISATTDVNGQATFAVRDGVVETVTYTATDTSDTPNVVITQTASVTFGNAVGSFNAFDTGTAAGTATAGYIQTKISGAAFALDVVALTPGSAVFTGFTGTVKVELVDGSSGACAAYANIQTLANQTFVVGDSGRHRIASITEANAWKNVRVRISYPAVSPTSVSCSSDNFAIRPSGFAILVQDANRTTAGTTNTLNSTLISGTPLHNAGQPFSVQATAVNAAALTTTNYTGTPVIVLSACAGTACTATLGTFSIGTWTAAVAGVINSTTATYSEAGAFTLQLQDTGFANVDAADGTTADCTGRYACSSVGVGRFVPDHFAVSAVSLYNRSDICPLGCGSFTYMGEPMTAVFKLTALAAGGGTTQNYAGAWAKLIPTAAVAAYTSGPLGVGVIDTSAIRTPFPVCTATPAHPCFTPLVASSGSFASGVATNITVPLTVYRGATAVGPFAALNLGIAPVDSDGVTTVYDLDTVNVVAGASNHTNLLVNGDLLYGRIKLANAYGSELLSLPITATVQFWNGSYVTSTMDSATQFNTKLSTAGGNVQAVIVKGPLALANISVITPGLVTFTSGVNTFKLGAPSVAGSVDMTIITAPGYLLPGSTGRATFGVYNGSNNIIYLRESY